MKILKIFLWKFESFYDVSSCLFMKTRSRSIGKRTECDREATQIKGPDVLTLNTFLEKNQHRWYSFDVRFFTVSVRSSSCSRTCSCRVISKTILYNTPSDIFVPFYKIKDKSSGENVRSNSKASFWTNFCNVLRFKNNLSLPFYCTF